MVNALGHALPRVKSEIVDALTPVSSANEVPRVLFLGICLGFHSLVIWVASPKLFFCFCRRTVAKTLVKP